MPTNTTDTTAETTTDPRQMLKPRLKVMAAERTANGNPTAAAKRAKAEMKRRRALHATPAPVATATPKAAKAPKLAIVEDPAITAARKAAQAQAKADVKAARKAITAARKAANDRLVEAEMRRSGLGYVKASIRVAKVRKAIIAERDAQVAA